MSDTIQLLFFAALQSHAGRADASWPYQEGMSCRDVYEKVAQEYNFPVQSANLRVAINHQFVLWQTMVQPNDIVAFIPPVSGG